MTDRYCVMGNPVEHSKSPWIHARFAELTAQEMSYGRLQVLPGDFPRAVQAFHAEGGCGCNVTVPFKFEAAALATRRSARAQLAQACNTLRFEKHEIWGDNTDGVGLVSDITGNAGVAIAGRELLLIGAGGAAAGVLGPLIEARPRRIVVANRGHQSAVNLVQRHADLGREHGVALATCALDAVPEAFDLVINATATSLGGGGVPVSDRVLRPGTLACDLMYGPLARGFLDWARRHGAVPRDGLGMLVEQAAESFSIWRGIRPASGPVLAQLRELMDAQP